MAGFDNGSLTTPQAVKANTETMLNAARLRAGGATFRQIGEELGLDHTWARELVLRALEESKYEAAELMRVQIGLRLDRLLMTFWSRALNGDVKAAEQCRRVIADQRALFGLDAPVRVDVADVTADVKALADELGVALPDPMGE